jgi:phosphoribosylanthranilate isomerase
MTPRAVSDIVKRLPPDVSTIGVFRDEEPQRILEIVNEVRLDGVQLHGSESVDDVAEVAAGVRLVIKAVVAGTDDAAGSDAYPAHAILVDGASPGSGSAIDWSLARQVPRSRRVVLAGGLTPENVADAIAVAEPWGVDVASGVEREPGRKDAVKVRHFIANARRAGLDAHDVPGFV